MIKKYLNIGMVVGTAITVERLVRKWGDITEEAKGQSGLWVLGGVIGAHLANLWNIVMWPVSLTFEIDEFIRDE